MEKILILDGDEKQILYLNNDELSGYKFHKDNTVDKIDASVLKYFNAFKLSSNNIPLGYENQYYVVLDKDTNFKHYFKDGVEDANMFFMNNGEDATLYMADDDEKNSKSSNYRGFKIFGALLIVGGIAFGIISDKLNLFNRPVPDLAPTPGVVTVAPEELNTGVVSDGIEVTPSEIRIVDPAPIDTDPIAVSWIRNQIDKSEELTEDEKEMLFNRDMIEHLLPYINKSEYAKQNLRDRIQGINIKYYNQEDHPDADEYYCQGNTIYLSSEYKDQGYTIGFESVLNHALAHMFQMTQKYGFLQETLAEVYPKDNRDPYGVLSYEKYMYSDNLTRQLANAVGFDTITNLFCTDNDTDFINKITPILSEDDLAFFKEFINDRSNARIAFLDSRPDKKETCIRFKSIIDTISIRLGSTPNDFKEVQPEEYISVPLEESMNNGLKVMVWDNDLKLKQVSYSELMDREFPDDFVIELPIDSPLIGLSRTFSYKDGENHYEALLNKNDCDMTFGEYVSKYGFPHRLNGKFKFGGYFPEPKEYELSDQRSFDYEDGSHVEILDDMTVVITGKDGEKRIPLDPESYLRVGYLGYIRWISNNNTIYRTLYPTGQLNEIVLTHDSGNLWDSTFQLRSSDGDVINLSGGEVISYEQDGKLLVPSRNKAIVPWVDKDGNVLGTKRYGNGDIWFRDQKGNFVYTAPYTSSSFDYFEVYNEEDKDGIIETFDDYGTTSRIRKENGKAYILSLEYPNGHKVSFDNNCATFYDEKGEILYQKENVENDMEKARWGSSLGWRCLFLDIDPSGETRSFGKGIYMAEEVYVFREADGELTHDVAYSFPIENIYDRMEVPGDVTLLKEEGEVTPGPEETTPNSTPYEVEDDVMVDGVLLPEVEPEPKPELPVADYYDNSEKTTPKPTDNPFEGKDVMIVKGSPTPEPEPVYQAIDYNELDEPNSFEKKDIKIVEGTPVPTNSGSNPYEGRDVHFMDDKDYDSYTAYRASTENRPAPPKPSIIDLDYYMETKPVYRDFDAEQEHIYSAEGSLGAKGFSYEDGEEERVYRGR